MIIFQKEGVDVLLVQFLESSLEQSQIAPFPIGDGTCLKEWFLLDGKAYTLSDLWMAISSSVVLCGNPV